MATIYEKFGTTKEEITNIVDNIQRYYISYAIKKRSGKAPRFINAPQGRLLRLQKDFLKHILYKFQASKIAHGFVCGKDPKTNARYHVGATTLVKIDFKNFFGSIRASGIRRLLRTLLRNRFTDVIFSEEDFDLLARLVTYRNQVPQGAPTSPTLTNLYVAKLDTGLINIAKNFGSLKVTRYADDITFSGSKKLSEGDKKGLVKAVESLAGQFGLKLNHKKTRIRSQASRLTVTGVVVNKVPNLPKETYRTLRARVHNVHTGKLALNDHEMQQLRGQLEWLRSINPQKAGPLLKKIGTKKSAKP